LGIKGLVVVVVGVVGVVVIISGFMVLTITVGMTGSKTLCMAFTSCPL
jgi:hypothetical protein